MLIVVIRPFLFTLRRDQNIWKQNVVNRHVYKREYIDFRDIFRLLFLEEGAVNSKYKSYWTGFDWGLVFLKYGETVQIFNLLKIIFKKRA